MLFYTLFVLNIVRNLLYIKITIETSSYIGYTLGDTFNVLILIVVQCTLQSNLVFTNKLSIINSLRSNEANLELD